MILKIKSNKFAIESLWSLCSKGAAFAFTLLLNIYLAKVLGPEDFGAWSFFFAILNILLLLSYFGVNASTKKFIAQFNATDSLGAVLISSFIIRIAFSLCFLTLFIIVYKSLANLLSRPELEVMFISAVPILFFAGLVEYFKNVFQGLHRLKYAFYVTFFEHGLKLLLTVIFLSHFNGLLAIVYSFNLALFIAFLVGISFYYYKFHSLKLKSSFIYIRDIISYSLPLFLISLGFTVLVEIDVLMIGLLNTDSEVGIYAVAKQIIVKLPHIALAISLGTMPVFAKLNADNKEKLTKLFNDLLKTNTVIFGFLGILIISTGWYFVPLLFGEAYRASVVPLMILVFYLIPFSYSIFLSTFLDYQGLAKKRAINLSLTITLNLILNLLLIPRYGAVGAAIGTTVSYAPYVVLNWLEVRKVLQHL